jgi:NADH:quinone reductase (non-electrogenic)
MGGEGFAREVSAPHVVIIGGGFAGLSAAGKLGGRDVRVTLLDRRNHHVFQPLLYQVATAGLSATEVAAPLRRILRKHRNVTVLLAEVARIDASARTVVLTDGEIGYDYLILGTGATHSYFGHDQWERFAPGLKSLEDALLIRRRMLLAFERAEREPDAERRRDWLTFVVIGGGPTGVELAGTLIEIARHTLKHEFRRVDPAEARVVLLEGLDRVLPPYPPDLSEKARAQLQRLGVEVRTRSLVTAIDGEGVSLGAERLRARTVLWAAGVAASPLGRSLGTPVDRAGRVKVEPDLSVPGHPEVFVAGDLAAFEQDGRPVPGVAPAAMQMGTHAAANVLRLASGQASRPFRYVDKGSLATIGRSAAVALIRGVKLWGLPAWLAWLGIHIFFLIGFRNRVIVMFEWALAYFTYERNARLILEPREQPPEPPPSAPSRPPAAAGRGAAGTFAEPPASS